MIKYSCYHKSRKLCECDGQTTYQAKIVDEKVSGLVQKIFSGIKGAPEEERLRKSLKNQMAANRAKQKNLRFQLKKDEKQLEKLQLEIANTLTGDSFYTPEDLSQAIQILKDRILDNQAALTELEREEREETERTQKVIPAYKEFKSWADEFDTASLEQKKMIVCQLFRRIEISRGYKITVEMNMTYQQFCDEWCQQEKEVM